MSYECLNCGQDFDARRMRGYCDECIELWNKQREAIHKRQRPSPGVCADGKFAKGESPQTVYDPESGRNVCGMCGSQDVSQGYGLGTGYGMGAYTFCQECYAFLDFVEDRE